MKVQVVKSFTLIVDGFHRLYTPPAVVELPAPERLIERGLVIEEGTVVAETPGLVEADDAVTEGEFVDTPSPVEAPSARPKQTQTTEVWRAYADSLGIDTKGMKTRQEIIAAVNAVE
ncbi:hypothetical protein ACQQ68_11060 [Corynebacterium diphtheriae]|uniref:hypothetical protein n=1 Tax=Corynebacterium diphtheriae TaxID=1717 RepID=UPI0013C5E1F3|nr:hypothetical protein [Corynebacterium diphtheriae]MBG9306417.1 hypothetical protein [Corynebacterium diphtheriae bv. mitis]CAB0938152.1 hypothetical protein FRC0458_00274 [Corynebacterium diphtheriae]